MKKLEYVTEVTVSKGRIAKSILIGPTKEQYAPNVKVVFQTLKPFVHTFVRDRFIAENDEASVLVRLVVKQVSQQSRFDIAIKLVSADVV